MHALWNDLKYAVRQLRRSPGFALTVVLTLALGVGANAVVFSVLNALILRPLPVPQADRLVFFNRTGNTGSSTVVSAAQSYPDYQDIRDGNRSLSGAAAYGIELGGLRSGGVVRQSWFYEASENYFDLLGIRPALGRFFHPADAHGPDSAPYVVLSYAYWQSQLHADPRAVGRTVELNKHLFTILGVAPEGFTGTELFVAPDLWAPLIDKKELDGYDGFHARGDHNLWVLGRLRPGVSVGQAEADLGALAGGMSRRYKADESLGFHLSRPGLLGDFLGRPVRAFLWGIAALAGLVLLAACANLGSLFASRAADRSREFSVRLALGASRAALVRQLAVEALLISLAGGAFGLALAHAAGSGLSAWRPFPQYPVAVAVHTDARVFLAALLLAAASGLFFGLLPARQVWRSDASLAARSGAGAGTGFRRWTLRDGLLLVQIALCSLLVAASLVAVRGLARSLDTSYGFQPQGAMLASFDMETTGRTDAQALVLERRALDALAAAPGTVAAGFVNKLPLSLSTADTDVWRDGVTDFRDSTAAADASEYDISPGYLAAAGTRLLAGRDFTWHDDERAPRVAVVNRTFARKVFGTADAVGRYFNHGGPRVEVVGVVEDGKYVTLTEDPAAAMFLPAAQGPDTQTTVVVRSRAGTAAVATAISGILSGIDPDLPVAITSWTEAMGTALFPSIAATAALGVMGGLAALLAVTGIFGMASYAVSKRLRELALRVALGAGRKDVLQAALGRPARLLLWGSLAGLGLGAAASRLLAHVVYGASPLDPVVLVGVVAAMAVLALGASWLPARRAVHVDPATLLREE